MGGLVGDAAARVVRVTGLRRVIDLRTAAEVESGATAELPASCARIHAPLFSTIRNHWIAPRDRSAEATAERYLEMLEDGAVTIGRVVEMLGEAARHPTVVHCAAGRDRTGIVIACVLDVLGVPEVTIAEDYALSDAVLADGADAWPETMRCTLELLRNRYGSTQAFLAERACAKRAIDRLHGALVVDRRPDTR
jgi:protein-tyrosine phosphatase